MIKLNGSLKKTYRYIYIYNFILLYDPYNYDTSEESRERESMSPLHPIFPRCKRSESFRKSEAPWKAFSWRCLEISKVWSLWKSLWKGKWKKKLAKFVMFCEAI